MLKKITIIGAGFVGATSAYALLADGAAQEIAIVDINEKLVRAQVMDLQHSIPFFGQSQVKAGSYSDIENSTVAVIACGAAQKPGETRLELVQKNAKIIKEIVPKIFEQNPNVKILLVSNPVDVLTYLACHMFPEKCHQIFGSGTVLDSARFRFLLGDYFKINPQSVHAYIVGEHGDSELPLLSAASVGNTPLKNLPDYDEKKISEIFETAKKAAYAIIEGKQATYYAIGAGVAKICRAVLNNENTVLPLSHLIKDCYGVSDVCLSMPVVLGKDGIRQELALDLDASEAQKLAQSAEVLKKTIKTVI